jgi:hypothetical protein
MEERRIYSLLNKKGKKRVSLAWNGFLEVKRAKERVRWWEMPCAENKKMPFTYY